MPSTKANIGIVVTNTGDGGAGGGDGGGTSFHGLPPGGSTSSTLVKRSADDFDAAWQPPGVAARSYAAIVGRAATLSIANNASTQVIMDAIAYDPYGITGLSAGGDPRNITLTPGFWVIEAHIIWAPNGTGTRTLSFNFGGPNVPVDTRSATGGGHADRSAAPINRAVVSNTPLRLVAYQDSGGALGITEAHLSAVRIGPS